ncbi:ComEA family DNA-binding protein [Cellulomonas sp. DKR-3]|uniref:ComEA family DNA-binding protein n=2 Tax=Cellulomonas fulva TaxID=2835530 RepID=A0ABS5U030_9CELL|nr:ComEA family DNA-binding protein [Cellulomonas fulva]
MRWRVAPRTVAAAALALVLVAGGVALRASVSRPGEPVELPVAGTGAGAAPGAVPGGAPDGASGAAPAVSAPASDAAADPTDASGPASSPGAAELVVVDVTGAVRRPGVVTLPRGARVVDAVEAAGGATSEADLSRLNLARVLVDGEQVVVTTPDDPLPAPPGAEDPGAGDGGTGGTGADGGLVDLNTADEAALDTLPGIGPVLAARIVEHRTTQPFAQVDDLEDVPGIGPALLAELRPLVTV